jgi:uncharacterized RDD family membrane protein YckC
MLYSTIKRRSLAFLIDIFIVGGLTAGILVAGMSIFYSNTPPPPNSILLIFAPFIITWLYILLSHIFFQKTIGKKLVHLKLVNKEGDKLNPLQVLLREILKIFSLPLLNGLLSLHHSKERRAWYEFPSGSVVVKTDSDVNDLSLKNPAHFIKKNKVLSLILALFILFIVFVVYAGNSGSSTSPSSQENTDSFVYALKIKREEIAGDHKKRKLTAAEFNAIYPASLQTLQDNTESLGKLLSDTDTLSAIVNETDEESKEQMLTAMAGIQHEYEVMVAFEVDDNGKHDLYTSALKDYSTGTEELAKALDDQEKSDEHIEIMTSLFESGNKKILELSEKL